MTYSDYQWVPAAVAADQTGNWTAPVVFVDDLGGGSECIRAHRLDDGRHVVHCTGTGDWLIPATVSGEAVVEMCEQAAHECYVAAGFDSPYA